MNFRRAGLLVSIAVAFCVLGMLAHAGGPRVLPEGQLPNDVRLGDLQTLNGYFPFAPPESVEAWNKRVAELRRQLLVSQGLWPMPEPTPLNVVIHGKVERDDFTVERVYFESTPGFFVTGSLFRPKKSSGKCPGVLCPHGHWNNGRFYDAGEKQVRQDIVNGAERFERSGRYPLQARCVQLARMGCVVFHYDMIGRADSQQLAHGAGSRAAMNTPTDWGFFSPQAELRLQTIMGLQTLDSIRALDFLASLPDVDPARIGVTGASGGGTQTFMLCALDERPAVAFPAVMVSTSMQGGCTCENASYLRKNTSNVEIAALAAPRPLGMTAADDWTREIATKGMPELKQLYSLLGVPENVMARPLLHFPHNYNYVSRAEMYAWFNKHLKLGYDEPIVEADFEPLSIAELTVWDDAHPRPPSGDDFERALVRQLTAASDMQIAALAPSDSASLARYRQVVGGAFEAMVGPAATIDEMDPHGETEHRAWTETRVVARGRQAGVALPAVILAPADYDYGSVVLWLSGRGKAGLFTDDGSPIPAVQALLAAGKAVFGCDLFGQGEFTADGKPLERTRLNDRQRNGQPGYAGYTFGYNDPLVVQRAHDVLGLIGAWENPPESPNTQVRIDLVAVEGAAPYVALARALAGARVSRTAIDTGGFRFGQLTAIDVPDFLPGAVKYGDLPALLALAAPGELRLTGETQLPAVTAAAYAAAGAIDRVTLATGDQADSAVAIAEWLLRK